MHGTRRLVQLQRMASALGRATIDHIEYAFPISVHPIHWQAAILPGDVAREQRDEEQYLANLPEPLRMSLSLSALALHSRGALLLLLLLLLTA